MEQLALGLTAGALAGNLVGELWRSLHLGWLVNTLAGLLGGAVSVKLLPLGSDPFMRADIVPLIGVALLGGAVVCACIGALRNLLSR